MIVAPVSRPPESGHGLVAAGAEVAEGVEATVDPGDRDPELAVGQVVGDDGRRSAIASLLSIGCVWRDSRSVIVVNLPGEHHQYG